MIKMFNSSNIAESITTSELSTFLEQPITAEKNFTLLRNGYYPFKVLICKPSLLPGYEDDTPRPVVSVRFEILNDSGNVVINHTFFINSSSAQMIHEFFASIGLAEEGEYVPRWDEVVGCTGGCYLGKRKLDYKTINVIERFVPRD